MSLEFILKFKKICTFNFSCSINCNINRRKWNTNISNKSRRRDKKIDVKLVIIIVIVIALFFLISQIILKSEEENSKKLEQARLAAREESICNIGDKITTNMFEITVTNIEERTKVGVQKYYSTVDDYWYILVCTTIQIKNISSNPQRIYDYRPDFSMYFKIEDFNGKRKYYNDPEYTAHYQFEFNNLDVAELIINSGETVTVSPVFKVDKNIYQNETFYLNILGGTAC